MIEELTLEQLLKDGTLKSANALRLSFSGLSKEAQAAALERHKCFICNTQHVLINIGEIIDASNFKIEATCLFCHSQGVSTITLPKSSND